MFKITLTFFLFWSCLVMAQESVPDLYRSYNIEVGLEGDSTTFDYEILFDATDSTSKSVYTTSSLDTFLYLLKEDLKFLPINKQQVFFYIHGMMGGQRMNFRMTKNDLRDRYIFAEGSDIGRIISVRWPGNKPAYMADKANVYLIAEALSDKVQSIIAAVREAPSPDINTTNFDIMNHSLGCELFKEMVIHFEEDKRYFDQILLCAPDLDVDVFLKEGPLEELYKHANRTTVYHSRKDLTLGFSRRLNEKGRLGLDGPHEDSHFHPSYNFIDMTEVSDETFLPMRLTGHAYYRGSDLASADMLATLLGKSCELIQLRVRDNAVGNCFRVVPLQE